MPTSIFGGVGHEWNRGQPDFRWEQRLWTRKRRPISDAARGYIRTAGFSSTARQYQDLGAGLRERRYGA
ncbi:hypothetical protein HMPREF1546_00784 [Oscillibacter sp. KLE 1745]|nr:hypothetical protein HMPREF1546_00784 [Oscillibacter sp. KLE 1745]